MENGALMIMASRCPFSAYVVSATLPPWKKGAQRGGDPLAPSYGPADLPPPESIPPPGRALHPGNFPDGYRGRLWTIRQYSGFGTPEESNERYRYLLARGHRPLGGARS